MAEHLGENPSSDAHSQQNETATPERESEVSKEITLGALKSTSNKRDGSSADKIQGCGKQFFALRGIYTCGNGFYCNDCKIDCSKKLNSGSKEC
jgi:hypothetical protein